MTERQCQLWSALKHLRQAASVVADLLDAEGIDPYAAVCDACGDPCMEGSVRYEDADICAKCHSEEPDE